jgi:hypothetical protein
MSANRNGKIARLPKTIRGRLGRRIDNGEQDKDLVEWLNSLPEVQDVLKDQFGGRPVHEQNLSEWKQGGHQEWLRLEETPSLASKLAEQSDDLDEAARGQNRTPQGPPARIVWPKTPPRPNQGPPRSPQIKPNQA